MIRRVWPLAVALALAACQAPGPFTAGWPTPAPVPMTGGSPPGGGTVTPTPSPGPSAAPTARPEIPLGLAGAPSTPIRAFYGGTHRDPNGRLTMVIPPGALSEDAVVRVAPVETRDRPNGAGHWQGLRFQADFGSAHLLPGTRVDVRGRADDRLVDALKAMYPGFDPVRYNMSALPGGGWELATAIYGPVPTGAELPRTDPLEGLVGPLVRAGLVPLQPPPAGSTKKQPSFEAFADFEAPPAASPVQKVCARVVWASDDAEHLDGKPAYAAAPEHVTVRFGTQVATTSAVGFLDRHDAGTYVPLFWGGVIEGPTEVVADAMGQAATWFREGTGVVAQARADGPNPTPDLRAPDAGRGAVAVSRAGVGGCLTLRVAKYSPQILLTLEGDKPLAGRRIVVTTAIDGGPGEEHVLTPVDSGQTFALYVRVATDDVHLLAIKSVATREGDLVGRPQDLAALTTMAVRRNGVYNAFVRLANPAPNSFTSP